MSSLSFVRFFLQILGIFFSSFRFFSKIKELITEYSFLEIVFTRWGNLAKKQNHLMRDHSGGGGGPIINYPCMHAPCGGPNICNGAQCHGFGCTLKSTFVNQLNFLGLLSLGGVMNMNNFLHTFQVFPTPNLMEVGTWKWGNSPTTQSIIIFSFFIASPKAMLPGWFNT